MNIAFIGAGGNIAGAIINGVLKADLIKPSQLYLFDINQEKLNVFKEKGAIICSDVSAAVRASDFIFLAVKPQIIFDVIDQIKADVTANKSIVSVAAGISIKSIKEAFGFNLKVIRVMPNTPLMVQSGASGIAFEQPIEESEIEFVQKIFNSAGISVLCDELQINTVTAVSGSGPAYVFKFTKAVVDQAEKMGLEKQKALQLFCNTLIGAAKMMLNSEKDIQQLIDMVTSPKGTTLAALESLDSNNFEDIIKQAMINCKLRADQLGKLE